MKKLIKTNNTKTLFALLFFSLFFFSAKLFSQQSLVKKNKIAVLCPLYLDSAFTDYSYNLGNNNMPQYILTGLDFYNGVMLAVDSLNKEHINAEVWIYDTKKKNTDINAILQSMKVLNFSLILASFTSPAEQKTVSDFSFANNIPVISVTYPNDAGITANPYFVMLNSTLKTHVTGIYNYTAQNFLYNKPIFVTKAGALESKIATDFKANDTLTKNHLQYRVMQLNNTVYFNDLKPYLDSNRQNTIICGSLNSDFALSLVKALGNNPQYKTTLIGMPNWDGMRKLLNNSFNNVNIVYSTAFNFDTTDAVVQTISTEYKAKFFARPSDLVYKGFYAMYRYTHLVNDYENELIGHLSDTSGQTKNGFLVQPVLITAQSMVPDYQENKNLFFVKKNKGVIVTITQLKK